MTLHERHFIELNPDRKAATKGGSLHWNRADVRIQAQIAWKEN
jgi:hypothetical protein